MVQLRGGVEMRVRIYQEQRQARHGALSIGAAQIAGLWAPGAKNPRPLGIRNVYRPAGNPLGNRSAPR
jgi:hypothetical protein